MSSGDERAAVTLRTIARAIGVSHVTVSLALHGNPKIPPERQRQIQTLAQQMGYRPNAVATALAHHKRTRADTPIRAALAWLNQWPQPHKLRGYREFDRYWQGAYAAAEKFGYRLEEFCCGERMPLPRLEKILLARGIRGILLPPHSPSTNWDGLHWERFSAARFGRSIQRPRLHLVTSDQVANTILAFRKIQDRGYRRIGFVTAHASERGALFKAGFLMAQVELDPARRLPVCVLDEVDPGSQRRQMARWLRRARPDAILTDVRETRERLQENGCRTPDDVGLAALSVLDGGADAGIDQHPEEIGRVAVLLVISLIKDHSLGVPPIFRQSLIEGSWVDGSTLPARLPYGASG